MICVHILRYLLRGWYLVREDDKVHLLISEWEDMHRALKESHMIVEAYGIECLMTMHELVQNYQHLADQEE